MCIKVNAAQISVLLFLLSYDIFLPEAYQNSASCHTLCLQPLGKDMVAPFGDPKLNASALG